MRIPLGVDLESRDGTLTKDAKVVNGFVEMAGEESYVYKRPGNEDLGLLRDGTAQLLVFWNGLKAIIGDYLNTTGSTTSAITKSGTTTWTTRTMPSSTTWQCVAWGNSKYVAVARSGAVATSPDGITWTSSATITARNWNSIAFNGTVFCVVATDSTATATSADGITWTQTGTLPAVNHYAIASNGTGLFVCARLSSQNAATSTDGLTWTVQTSVMPSAANWQFICYNGSVFCATDGTGSSTKAATTTDGVTWTARTLPNALQSSGVVGGGGIIVALAASGTLVSTSSDNGATWTSVTFPFTQTTALPAAWNGTAFLVAISSTSTNAAISTDGLTWTASTMSTGFTHTGAASNGTGFVVLSTGTASATEATTITYAPVVTSTNLSPTTAGLQFSAQDNGSNAGTQYLMIKNDTQAWSLTNASGATPTLINDVDYPGTYAVTLTSLTRSGTTATATTPSDTNFQVGSSVTIAGATPSAYNGAQTVTAVTPSSVSRIGPVTVTITRSGTTATATSLVPHGFSNGDSITHAGATQSEYNGVFTITWISATSYSFTVTVTASLTTPATGSPALRPLPIGFSYYNSVSDPTVFTCVEVLGGDVMVNGETITVIGGHNQILGSRVITTFSSNGFTFTVPGVTAQISGSSGQADRVAPTISSITSVDGLATVTTSAAHNFLTSKQGSISGASPAGYNTGFVRLTVTGASTFTYAVPTASPITPATGTINATKITQVGSSFTFTISGSPTTPATGTITAAGGRNTVPGICYLNGYFTVVDIYGVLYNSAPDDPRTWNALEYTTADSISGAAKAHAQTLNYLLVFKEWSIEPFYDRQDGGVGSPFAKLDNGLIQIGCASGYSLAKIDGSIFWMSQTRQEGRAVHVMTGTEVQKISTPAIDRVLKLDSLASVRAWAMKINGHSFYILTLVTTNVTLVYDATSQKWGQWTSVDDYFKYTHFANALGRYMTLHASDGHLYEFDTDNYQDAGVTISTLFRTVRLDGGALNPKVMRRATVIGDKVADTLDERHSDDDCTTFSSYRTANLAYAEPMYRSLGSFRRRTMEFRHTGNFPIRLKAIELEVQ